MNRFCGKTNQLFYFRASESLSPINVPIPTPASDFCIRFLTDLAIAVARLTSAVTRASQCPFSLNLQLSFSTSQMPNVVPGCLRTPLDCLGAYYLQKGPIQVKIETKSQRCFVVMVIVLAGVICMIIVCGSGLLL